MRHLRIYENFKPKKGDYVLIETDYVLGASPGEKKIFFEFVNNTIGEIVNVNNVHNNITVKYTNIPFQIRHFFGATLTYMFPPKNIKYISDNKEDIRTWYEAEKYNL